MDFPRSLCLQNSIRKGVPLDLLREITTGEALWGHWGAFVDSNLVKLKHLGYLVCSIAPGAQVDHGHGGGDAPGTEEDILGVGACICKMLEEIEGKDCICHIKFFHCLNLEGK